LVAFSINKWRGNSFFPRLDWGRYFLVPFVRSYAALFIVTRFQVSRFFLFQMERIELHQNDSGISLSPNISNQSSSNNGTVTVDAAEYIGFCLHRLWFPFTFKEASAAKPIRMPILQYPDLFNGSGHWYRMFIGKVKALLTKMKFPTPIIFIALLYIGRLRTMISFDSNQSTKAQQLYQLLVSALILAHKQNSDYKIANTVWSAATGYSLEDINLLERCFLKDLRWAFHVSDTQYSKWLVLLRNLGKEHDAIMKSLTMNSDELVQLSKKLESRPDMINEIQLCRDAFVNN
jgi:hypothetical protein